MVHDPGIVDSILNLINDHQSAIIRPMMLETNSFTPDTARLDLVSQTRMVRDSGLHTTRQYQPIPFDDDPFSDDELPFCPMGQDSGHVPFYPSAPDSGFYSESSAMTRPDGLSMSLRPAEAEPNYAYSHADAVLRRPELVRRALVAGMGPTTTDHSISFQSSPPAPAELGADTDLDSQFVAWGDEEDQLVHPEQQQVPDLTTFDCDEHPHSPRQKQ
jgi:hypothetical protein